MPKWHDTSPSNIKELKKIIQRNYDIKDSLESKWDPNHVEYTPLYRLETGDDELDGYLEN